MSELKKRILEDDVANITRSGKYYKPSFLKKDHSSRNLGEGSKPIGLNKDKVLAQLKGTYAHVCVLGFLMAFHKH